MDSTQVTFDLPDTASEVAFLQEYMVPAWRRFERDDDFESGYFWRAGSFAHADLTELTRDTHELDRLAAGTVVFILNGNPDAVLRDERERWEQFREAGLLDGWETVEFRGEYENHLEKLTDKYGSVGGQRMYRLRTLAASFTVEYLDAFDDPLPADGERTADDPVGIGFWTAFHLLSKHAGYGWYDEIDACRRAIENRLVSLATFTSDREALETLDRVIEQLETARDQFEGGRAGAGPDR